MATFWANYGDELVTKLGQHLFIWAVAMGLGVLVAVPLGVGLVYVKRGKGIILGVVSVFQTVPALALLTLMIPFFGIGRTPTIIALFIYSLLPIVQNTYEGLIDVGHEYLDAGMGMGMSTWQQLWHIRLPMALAAIISGIRISAVYVISWTTLAAYIGAGGLGDFIFSGLNLYRMDLVMAGTIPISLLALIIDNGLLLLERHYTIGREATS